MGILMELAAEGGNSFVLKDIEHALQNEFKGI